MRPARYYVERLGLLPHPEGGHYRETYRSTGLIPRSGLPAGFAGPRSFSTSIYFLLEAGEFSAFHRIMSDEGWHFYAGGPLEIYVLHPGGGLELIRLGPDDAFQAVVPAGCWFASRPAPGTAYALAGCTVAPGFDFDDFELADAAALAAGHPAHGDLIKSLCR